VNGGLIRSHVADSPDKLYLPAGLTSRNFREVPLRFFRQAKRSFVAHPFGLEGLEMAHRLLTAEVSDCQRPLLSRQAPREVPNARRASHDQPSNSAISS